MNQQLLAEGPLLPRGKSSSVVLPSNEEDDHQPRQKRLHQQQHNEETGLFGKSSTASKLAKKRQDQSKAAQVKKIKVEDEKEKEARRLQTRLTLSRVTKGMKLLGCVTRVTKDKIVLQLCNNMTCVVAANEVSDEHFDCSERGMDAPSTLKDAVPVNKFVPLVVLDTDGMIKCSMRCSLLNKAQLMQIPLDQTVHLFASVRSVEDHGVILNLGLRHLQGFLPFSNGTASHYVVGQCGIEVSFQPNKAINGMVTVKLASADSAVPNPVPSFASLFPGTNVAVSRMVRDDLVDGGSLFSIPVATAEVQAVCDWAHSAPTDDVEVATVLWADYTAKTLGLSFLPHIVNRLRERFVPSPMFKVGDLVHEAKVVRLQTRIGVVLEKDSVPFFASVTRLVDSGGAKNKQAKESLPSPAVVRERFGLDTVHTLRVLEANPMEAMLVCSLQDSAVLTGGETIDLTPGKMISARVVKIDARLGLFVQVAHSCRGLVTLQHLGDSTSNTQDISKRFRVDQELKAMILSHTEEKTYFTLKKSLMTSTLPIVTAYDMANVGVVTLGTVVKVDSKFGLILTFFNNVQGLVPLHDLGENVVKDMHDLYRVGQVVKVKVLQVNKELERMRLSLKTTSALPPTTTTAQQQSMQGEEDPTMVSVGTVVTKLEDSLLVEFKRNDVLLRGNLHKMHLSDFPSLCDVQFTSLRVGSKVRNFMVLDSKRKPFTLTLKQELIAQANRLPSKLEQVDLDQVYTCAVHNKQDFGVFVHFAGGLTGFVPRANVADNQQVQHPALLSEHATVRVLVTAVDADKQRMTCSLKPSVVGGYAQYLTAWLQATRPAGMLDKWRNVKKLVCTVTHRVENVGVALSIVDVEEDGYSAFCALEHCPAGKLPEVGQTITFTRVLDVNFDTKVVDVSARKSLKTAVWRAAEEEVGEAVEVELWRREYCVVSYRAKRGGDGRVLALVSLVSFNQTAASNALPIKFGTKLQCLSVSGFAVLERDHAHQQPAMMRTTRLRSDSLTEFLGPKVKVELNAIIPVKIRDIRGCWARLDVRADVNISAIKIKQTLLHSCDVLDPPKAGGLQDCSVDGGAFATLSIGDVVQAKVVEIAKNKTVYFSLRPAVLASQQDQDEVFSWEENRLPEVNKVYDAWVDEVLAEGVMVGLSRHMRGYCVAMHVSNDLELLDEIFNSKQHSKQVLPVGRPIRVEVLDVDSNKKRVEVKMVWE